MIDIRYERGVFLPRQNLWLDPWEAKDFAFVSHAHSDHIAPHRQIIVSERTACLMQARLPGKRREILLPFGQEKNVHGMQVTLFPAGHIFGSAQFFLRTEDDSLLYTGDFKLRRGQSAEPAEWTAADTLIMETTYGLPRYRLPPTEEVIAQIVAFCRDALDNNEVPVLLGYSLGKAQEILCALAGADLTPMLHGAVYQMTRIYEQYGQKFCEYVRYRANDVAGKVLICPPGANRSRMLEKIPRKRVAMISGWAVEPNAIYRYQVDTAFPLSDHADYDDLLRYVDLVKPKRVFTLHGFAGQFAGDLRARGIEAWALTEENQMELTLGTFLAEAQVPLRATAFVQAAVPDGKGTQSAVTADATVPSEFLVFANVGQAIAATPAKLEKIRLLAEYFSTLDDARLSIATVYFTGHAFPQADLRTLQVGGSVIYRALASATRIGEPEFRRIASSHGDAGKTAFEVLDGRTTPESFDLIDSYEFFEQLHKLRGPAAKKDALQNRLARLTAREGQYVVKILSGDLRIGLREGLVEEAIAKAFAAPLDEVKEANMLLGDIGRTAVLAKKQELYRAELTLFRPIKCMLATPEPTADAIWKRFVDVASAVSTAESQTLPPRTAATTNAPLNEAAPVAGVDARPSESDRGAGLPTDVVEAAIPGGSSPDAPFGITAATERATVYVEDKFDGIRAQLHASRERAEIFSRDLKRITGQFPELAEQARAFSANVILDGEIMAYSEDRKLTFFDLQKRLGRKSEGLDLFEAASADVPVIFVAFDLLFFDGRSLLRTPLRERRELLRGLNLPPKFQIATVVAAHSANDIEIEFKRARLRLNEGLMIKDPTSFYSPGRRGLFWFKLKKELATLDVVVVAAELGHGKRNHVLSDYTFAVRDEKSGQLLPIGKAYSGLTDAEIAELTEHFEQNTLVDHGRYREVRPDIVLEVAFNSIQPSTRHASGLALRFPRIKAIRRDKTIENIDTLSYAQQLAAEKDRGYHNPSSRAKVGG
ncbi:MAG TPA: MBL fold metallo-hydrolase RNA specificity domain-containing protein [Chthoniobacterales bacterium]|nr:MBL fold metallo-hydrolase RNA specificity domain-containing protein [Chthoniobacterales bacterium]